MIEILNTEYYDVMWYLWTVNPNPIELLIPAIIDWTAIVS